MEYPNTNQSLFNLRINENTKIQLRGAAVVAGISAILTLVSAILSITGSFIARNKTVYQYEGFGQTRVETGSNILGSVIMLVINVLLFYFLNRFSTQTKQGLNASNSQLVNNGLGGLSAYFVTIGILLIIALLFMLIIIAAGVSSGAR
ncbi:MAG TPA: hypothetical protein VI461_01470 [Chitinophagaceae bacterium]|nr:hypothetical protein [Chitinophagaceae bacterium]